MGHSSIILTYCYQHKTQLIVFYQNIKVPWLHFKHSGQEPGRAGGPLTSPSWLVAKEGRDGKKTMYFSNILQVTHSFITVTCLNSIPTFQRCLLRCTLKVVTSLTEDQPNTILFCHRAHKSSWTGPIRALQMFSEPRYRVFSGKTLGG